MKSLVLLLVLSVLCFTAQAENISDSFKAAQADRSSQSQSALDYFSKYYVNLEPDIEARDVVTSFLRVAPLELRQNLKLIRAKIGQTEITNDRLFKLADLNRNFKIEIQTMNDGFISHYYWHRPLLQMALTFITVEPNVNLDPEIALKFIMSTDLTTLMGLPKLIPDAFEPNPTLFPEGKGFEIRGYDYNPSLMAFEKK